jgi:hypothetical protein
MADKQVQAYLREMAATQQQVIDELSNLQRQELKYATGNARWNTVRRVMLRFGDHLREHTTQLLAAREAIGAQQTMPQRMLARAQEAYGVFLGAMVGLSDEDLDRVPEAGEWTARQVLEHMLATQQVYLDMVRQGRRDASPVEKD